MSSSATSAVASPGSSSGPTVVVPATDVGFSPGASLPRSRPRSRVPGALLVLARAPVDLLAEVAQDLRDHRRHRHGEERPGDADEARARRHGQDHQRRVAARGRGPGPAAAAGSPPPAGRRGSGSARRAPSPAPGSTSAMSTASAPATSAPMIGMKAPKNVSTARGSASGTPKTTRPMPMKTASTKPMSACERMNPPRRSQLRAPHLGEVVPGRRPRRAAHPGQELRAVLDEQEREHQREHRVDDAVGHGGEAGEDTGGDLARALLEALDGRLHVPADLARAEVERRSLQPALDLLDAADGALRDLRRLTGHGRRDQRHDPAEQRPAPGSAPAPSPARRGPGGAAAT